MNTPFFELGNISKCFTRVMANKDIFFSIQRGEVLVLLGENRAGKSTVTKILYGLYKADKGQIFMDGKEQKISSPRDAMALGVSMIQQHFPLVNAHTVTKNIVLGNVHGVIDYGKCRREVENLSRQHGFDIPVDAKIADLAVGVQQKVEILKALYLKTSLLIMDGPTAVPTPQELETPMQLVEGYMSRGNSVIFITHKAKEVMEAADEIIVVRNGHLTGDPTADETSEMELTELVIGKGMVVAKREENEGDRDRKVYLELQDVTVRHRGALPVLNDLSFRVMGDEIFGMAGVSGNEQEELCEAICGTLPVLSGRAFFRGRDITSASVRERVSLGIGYIPVDRCRDAMVGKMTLTKSVMLRASFNREWTNHGFLNRKKLHEYTLGAIKDFEIRVPGPDTQIRGLSSDSQQKVILAREVNNAGEMLVMDRPTRGLNLDAVNNIYTNILEEHRKGRSILLVSTELSEIFELCDRIIVICKGVFMGIYRHDELATERIGFLMAGYRGEKGA